MTITVRYGLSSATRTFSFTPSVSDIKRDASLRAELGYGDNVRVMVDGVPMPDNASLEGIQSVTVETAANQKAA